MLEAQTGTTPKAEPPESQTYKPFFTGRVWYSYLGTGVGLFSNLEDSRAYYGGVFRFDLGFEDIAGFKGPGLGTEIFVRYQGFEKQGPAINPGLGLVANWRFDAGDYFSFGPLVGANMFAGSSSLDKDSTLNILANSSDAEQITLQGDFFVGLQASLGIIDNLRLLFDARFIIPFYEERDPLLSVSFALRSLTSHRLSVGPAAPKIAPSTQLFSPDGDGQDDLLRISLNTTDKGLIKEWTLTIIDDRGVVVRNYKGSGPPPDSLTWDGSYENGVLVESATDLKIQFTTQDVLGRTSQEVLPLLVDILVIKEGDLYKIRLPNIEFPANSSSLNSRNAQEFLEKNRRVLTRLAQIISKFPSYSIVIEGHSNATRWNDLKAFEREQKTELVPLSASRAQTVKEALVRLGLEAKRMSTLGVGAAKPLVPFDSRDNWKNRRVEFILIK